MIEVSVFDGGDPKTRTLAGFTSITETRADARVDVLPVLLGVEQVRSTR